MKNLLKTATIAALVGVGAIAATGSAEAQPRYGYDRYDRWDYDRNVRRECNRFGECYTVTCNRFGRNCYRSNYYRSGFNDRGRYYVCDRFNRCAWAPYPRSYYQRYPRAGFSFGFSF